MYILSINRYNKGDRVTKYTRKTGKHLTKQEKQEVQDKFIASFAENANVSLACKEANISRNTIYEWQEHDETFSMRFKVAEQEANDVIRAELFRRGVTGYEKPVVSMGKVVYDKETGERLTENVYSDNLLALLAKSRMPEFRDKQTIDMNNTNNQDMRLMHEAIAKALEPYPEARQAVASALAELESVRAK